MKILDFVAETIKIDSSKINNLPKNTAVETLGGILNGVYFAVGAVAVVIIILAGYTFVTAVYDPAKIAKAKNAILYSVVGLIVVILAFVITSFVMGRF